MARNKQQGGGTQAPGADEAVNAGSDDSAEDEELEDFEEEDEPEDEEEDDDAIREAWGGL